MKSSASSTRSETGPVSSAAVFSGKSTPAFRVAPGMLFPCVSRPSYSKNLRQTITDGGQWRKGRVGFGLIPVCNREVVVGSCICMPVLNACLYGFRESDGRVKVEAIYGRAFPGQFGPNGRSPIKGV